MIRKPRITPSPFFFDILQGIQAQDPTFPQLLEKLQRLAQITQLIHDKNLREKDVPHTAELGPAAQPVRELTAACGREFVYQAARPALGMSAARAQPARFLHAL